MMTNQLQFKKWPAFSVLSTFFWCCTFAAAQSATAQTPPQDHDNVRSAEDRHTTRHELASFDQFLDSHRETAEQLRKDPSLVDNQKFLNDHPVLQSYLKDHPGVRQELRENPNAFMQEEARYDRREDAMNREGGGDHDFDHSHSANFGEFLGAHANIAQDLSKDPSLAKSQDYLQDHPELQDYLNSHPEVRQDLQADPQNFLKSAQQFNNNGQGIKPPTAPTADSKPKQ